MRFILFLLSLCLLALAAPIRRDKDVLSLISELKDSLQTGQASDLTSVSQSLASLPTAAATADFKAQVAIKVVSIIGLALDKNLPGLKDLIVSVEKCVPDVSKDIYRIMNVGMVAKLRASGSTGDVATLLNQAELKAVVPEVVI